MIACERCDLHPAVAAVWCFARAGRWIGWFCHLCEPVARQHQRYRLTRGEIEEREETARRVRDAAREAEREAERESRDDWFLKRFAPAVREGRR